MLWDIFKLFPVLKQLRSLRCPPSLAQIAMRANFIYRIIEIDEDGTGQGNKMTWIKEVNSKLPRRY